MAKIPKKMFLYLKKTKKENKAMKSKKKPRNLLLELKNKKTKSS
jgi:hypothetical protein